MPLSHQLADILVGGLVATVSFTLLGFVLAPSYAVAMGAFFAAMYYFSRNPWGSPDGEKYNDSIDDFYDRLLP
jgi:hypothetical protein